MPATSRTTKKTANSSFSTQSLVDAAAVNMKHSPITSLKPRHIILGLIVLLFPYINLLALLKPIGLFGKNAYLILIVGLTVYAYLHYIFFVNRGRVNIEEISALVLFLFFIAILVVRYFYYGESRNVLSYHHFILPVMFLFVAKRLIDAFPAALVIGYVLVVSALLQSVFVILHSIWFSNIQVIATEFVGPSFGFDMETTRDGLLGASIGSYQIICGMFMLYALNKVGSRKNVLRWFLYYLLLLFMFYAIAISGSRYPTAVAMLLILASVDIRRNLNSKEGLAFIVMVVCAGAYFWFYFQPYSNFRFFEDSGQRIDKLLLSLTMLTDNSTSFLLGASSETVGSTVTVYGATVSDNSYMLIALEAGVPFALLFFVTLVGGMSKIIQGVIPLLFLAFVVVGLSLTNSILWTSWIFIVMITLVVISSVNRKCYPPRRAKQRWVVPGT